MTESDRVVECLERAIRDCYALLLTADPVYTGDVDACWLEEWLTDARQVLGHHSACCHLFATFNCTVQDGSAHDVRRGLAILERAQALIEGNLIELPTPDRGPVLSEVEPHGSPFGSEAVAATTARSVGVAWARAARSPEPGCP